MEIERSENNGTVRVRVAGCLDTAASAGFGRELDQIPAAAKEVLFDFSGLDFIASSALRAMVSLCKRLGGASATIKIAGANEVVRDVFEVTGLVEVFELV